MGGQREEGTGKNEVKLVVCYPSVEGLHTPQPSQIRLSNMILSKIY